MNYGICHEENFKKGKIVKFNDDGTINSDFKYLDLSITKNVLALFISIALLSLSICYSVITPALSLPLHTVVPS